jgi:hypothetical protein
MRKKKRMNQDSLLEGARLNNITEEERLLNEDNLMVGVLVVESDALRKLKRRLSIKKLHLRLSVVCQRSHLASRSDSITFHH